MDYLIYVEHSAENLQFYLWYHDYVRRWNALSNSERALSPELQPDQNNFPKLSKEPFKKGKLATARPKLISRRWNANGMSFLLDDEDEKEPEFDRKSFVTSSLVTSTTLSNEEISAKAGLKWQPCEQR